MKISLPILLTLVSTLTGCESLAFIKSNANVQKTIQETKIAQAWQATLPHGGKQENLKIFWAQYDDALLLDIIDAAQKESPTIATANTHIADARAQRIATNANVLPSIDANASATRSKQGGNNGGGQFGGMGSSISNNYNIGLQASWELDTLGANKVLMAAAERREKASQSAWHDARVSVAAEAATSYFNQRFCTMQTELNVADAQSKAETARLTELSYKAGFAASGALKLAQAAAADGAQQLKSQQAQCDIAIKELVALTGWDEGLLRQKLADASFKLESGNTLFAIDEVPATVIAQRPDIDNAEADLLSAEADIKTAQVARMPRVTLQGSIGWQHFTSAQFSSDGETWSLGPLSVTLPIFDGGKSKANQETAEAKYLEQAATYRSKVRNAVKEVETALVNLHSAQSRTPDIAVAIEAYQSALQAMEQKYQAGFLSLIELEESRRDALQAKMNQVNLMQARNNAWINLYRAVGGGWEVPQMNQEPIKNQ